MVEVWKTVAMGVVEGLTEFLPISSTGHMILVGKWIQFPEELAKTFDVFIQLGAILAVVIYFRARLLDWLTSFASSARKLEHPLVLVLIAFVPAAGVGFLTHKWITANLMNPVNVAIALIVGGLAIEVIERTRKEPTIAKCEDMPLKVAIAIGCFQCIALFPGVSRSAATIMGGMLMGLTLPAAAEFSFFLAIPTMCAASGYSLWKVRNTLSTEFATQLGIGFVVAFVVALMVVHVFMRYIQRNSFRPFVIYRILLGTAVLGSYLLGR